MMIANLNVLLTETLKEIKLHGYADKKPTDN